MFFHIDESGNTGNNLFDYNQPKLSYGVLSSSTNVDVLCTRTHRQIQKIIGDELIHANVLGTKGLTEIAPQLIEIQDKFRFDFDYYFIDKTSYALTIFFDAVFVAGLNDAVKWDTYWTPLRYLIIHKLAVLFDEELLKDSWRLCTAKKIERHEEDIIALLTELKRRTGLSELDQRSKEVIIDALDFGISKPLSLDFGFPDQKMISPNAVGFQFVVSSIARKVRKKNKKRASSIVVDRQTQFNKAQIGTHYNLNRIAEGLRKSTENEKRMYLNHPLYVNFDNDEIVHKGLSDEKITISKSSDSIGLQIVDVYLWVANKVLSGDSLSHELIGLWQRFSRRSLIDGISLEGMERRFQEFEKLLPQFDELTEEQLDLHKKSVEEHRHKVRSLKVGS